MRPIVLTYLLLFVLPLPVRAELETPIALEHARIVVSPDQTLETGSVLIEEGRIVDFGTDIAIPGHARRLDATGLVIYPGFINANSHLGITVEGLTGKQRKRMEDENPDVREGPQSATVQAHRRMMHPHWQVERLIDPDALKKDQMRKAGFCTVLVAPQEAIFAGQSAAIQMGEQPLRRSVVQPGFAQHAAFVRTGWGGREYPITTMGAMAAFRQIMLDAQWHRELIDWANRDPLREQPPLDRDLETLWRIIDQDQPIVFNANTENEIHRALNMAGEFNLRPIIAGGTEAWRVADRLAEEDIPVILGLNWAQDPLKKYAADKKKKDDDSGEKTAKGPRKELLPTFDDKWEQQPFESQQMIDERARLWEEQVDNALRLHEKGVNFAIGSFELSSPDEVLKRMRLAVERGLPEQVAIAALTRYPAEILGIDQLLGDIAPGKLANLTILSKPISDKKSKVQWIFVEGERFDLLAGESDKGSGRRRGGNTESDKPGEGENEEADSDDEEPKKDKEDHEDSPEKKRDTLVAGAPFYEIETEADRKPALQTGGNVLIRNANLLTITNGNRDAFDLLISDGKIARIDDEIGEIEDVMIADLSGYYIMPGIIDAHSHMCSDGGLNEASLSVTCEVRIRDVIDHRDVGAFRALAGGVTAIHTMHGSANTIGGQNATLRLKYGKPAAQWLFPGAPRTVKFALGENVKQSNSRNRGTRFPNSRMGVEAVMRRAFDTAIQYRRQRAEFEKEKEQGSDPQPLRRDLRLEALVEILEGDIWVHTHCYRADEVLRLLDVAEDYGFRIGVLQHILEGYRIIPEIARHGCGASTFSDWWAYKLEAYNAIPYNAARMTQGGVVASLNSDSAEMIRHLNLEAAKTVRFGGLSPNDALRLITINPAIQLGIEKYVGSIEEGKFADLAIFDGHPLDTSSRCVMTLIDGEIYFLDESLNVTAPPEPQEFRSLANQREPLPIRPSATGNYWIVGAEVHSMRGAPIKDGLLAIAGERIAYAGPRGDRRPPPGATIIQADGLRVYPGLINCGTSLGLTEIRSVRGSVDSSDIGTLQPDLLAVSAYNPHSEMVDVTRAEGVTTALIMPGGSVIAGQAGIVHLAGWTMPEALAVQSTALVVNLPSLPIEYPRQMTPEQKKRHRERKKQHAEQIKKIDEFFRNARHYAKVSQLAKDNPDIDLKDDREFEAMMPYVRKQLPVIMPANSFKEIKEALHFAERFELRPIIYGGREAWKLADELAEKKTDIILVSPATSYPRGNFEPWDSVYRNASALSKAGVRFAFATGGSSLAKLLGPKAGMTVAYGLDRERALKAMTGDAAAILGIEHELGTLEKSKLANVVITTDSPLQASNRVVAEFIRGRPIDLGSKHTRLDDKFRSRPDPELLPGPVLSGPPAMRLGEAAYTH